MPPFANRTLSVCSLSVDDPAGPSWPYITANGANRLYEDARKGIRIQDMIITKNYELIAVCGAWFSAVIEQAEQ